MMPAKIRSAGNLSQNSQEAVIATYICFLTNFTELELTNIQANYWWSQMHCGPSDQSFGWAMDHPVHAAAPPRARREWTCVNLAATWTYKISTFFDCSRCRIAFASNCNNYNVSKSRTVHGRWSSVGRSRSGWPSYSLCWAECDLRPTG